VSESASEAASTTPKQVKRTKKPASLALNLNDVLLKDKIVQRPQTRLDGFVERTDLSGPVIEPRSTRQPAMMNDQGYFTGPHALESVPAGSTLLKSLNFYGRYNPVYLSTMPTETQRFEAVGPTGGEGGGLHYARSRSAEMADPEAEA
jgi:hypothetical protein